MAIKLADKQDIPEGGALVVQDPDGREIALFNLNNEIFALENTCPHMGGPIGEGDVEDCVVTCPWHGWQFDIKTGQCQNMSSEEARKVKVILEGTSILLAEK